ncbi:transketolase [Paenarthrobacter aromaticivorans]|uniref:transketolase n=1 Tax=Paenarthrobacter aromaticivorans TaxID=2849150 RepID=UPI003A7F8B61
MSTKQASKMGTAELNKLSAAGRWHVLNTVASAKAGHIGGPLSAMDLLVSLYFNELTLNPQQPQDPTRDRFILSKGHCAIGLYAVLAMRGYFPLDELATFDQGGSRLQGHPDMKLTPGVDSSSGSLGQGLSAGAGMAIAAKRLGAEFHTWVMLGDGELEEGMVWEAVHTARRFQLDNLTAIIDLNGLQQYGWPVKEEGDRFDRSNPWAGVDLEKVFAGFGWNVVAVDGHNFDEIQAAFDQVRAGRGSGRPTVILATTTKGKGVSFTQGTYKWHNGVATPEQLAIAAAELGQTFEGEAK